MVGVSIIINNFKSKAKTLACLDSIRKSEVGSAILDIVVIDNASGDELEADLRNLYPEVRFFQSATNTGMGGGNNFAFSHAQAKDYILVLNPDTELRPDTIGEMVAYMENNPNVGMMGPRLVYPDGETQQSYFRFPSIFMPLLRRTPLGKIFQKQLDSFLFKDMDTTKPNEVDWLMGSCLLVRGSLIEKIGGLFDDLFFMYFEDTDLAKRIWKAGYKVIYYPLVECVHHHARMSAGMPWYIAPFKNRLARIHIFSFLKYMWKWKFR